MRAPSTSTLLSSLDTLLLENPKHHGFEFLEVNIAAPILINVGDHFGPLPIRNLRAHESLLELVKRYVTAAVLVVLFENFHKFVILKQQFLLNEGIFKLRKSNGLVAISISNLQNTLAFQTALLLAIKCRQPLQQLVHVNGATLILIYLLEHFLQSFFLVGRQQCLYHHVHGGFLQIA